jgi:hypothetical protein
MITYRVSIIADRYPTEYFVQASGWATAVARAIREWKKKFKGSRTQQLKINVIKGSRMLTTDDKEL